MKTIFDREMRNSLITRIKLLNETSSSQWGKMNARQMLLHCTRWDEMMLGKTKHHRMLLGYLFGRVALPDFVKDDSPMKRNVPTAPGLTIKKIPLDDFNAGKEHWVTLLNEYPSFSNSKFVHPFFGKMTREQGGILAYKHADHHLQQFNC